MVAEISSQVILLNALFLDYGPEANQNLVQARQVVEEAVDLIWSTGEVRTISAQAKERGPMGYGTARTACAEGREPGCHESSDCVYDSTAKTDFLADVSAIGASFHFDPLLIVVTLWLFAIFVSFGIFAPSNATVMVTLIRCALAASGANFHHCGHVLAIQRHPGDFSRRYPRCIEPAEPGMTT